MFDPVKTCKNEIRSLTDFALKSIGYDGTAEYSVEYSAISEHGEFSTNAAFVCASGCGMTPMDLAKKLEGILSSEKALFEKVSADSPGYINFWMSPEWYRSAVTELLRIGSDSEYTAAETAVFSPSDLSSVSFDPLYEYAWICSILRAYASPPDLAADAPSIGTEDPAERKLLNLLLMHPSITERAEKRTGPAPLLRYMQDLSSCFRALRDEEGRNLGLAASRSYRLFLYGTMVKQSMLQCLSLFCAEPPEYI